MQIWVKYVPVVLHWAYETKDQNRGQRGKALVPQWCVHHRYQRRAGKVSPEWRLPRNNLSVTSSATDFLNATGFNTQRLETTGKPVAQCGAAAAFVGL